MTMTMTTTTTNVMMMICRPLKLSIDLVDRNPSRKTYSIVPNLDSSFEVYFEIDFTLGLFVFTVFAFAIFTIFAFTILVLILAIGGSLRLLRLKCECTQSIVVVNLYRNGLRASSPEAKMRNFTKIA